MTDPRARFCFVAEAADARSTVAVVRTIQLEDDVTIYEFPQNYRKKEQHGELYNTTVVKGVVKSLNARGKYRNVWITLTDELKGHYLDEEGNVCYDGMYLDECRAYNDPNPIPTQLQENASHDKLSSRVKNMILDKFSGKNQNAKMFMDLFVDECTRLKIKGENYAETLKFFLEGPALDWFQSFLRTHKITRPWEFWKNSFIDTFAVIGWSEIKYAYEFRYIDGPLLDYALRKRSLLLNADSELSENTQINFIVLGLPQQTRAHIKRGDFSSIDGLMACIHQLEGFSPINKNKIKGKNVEEQSEKANKKPCFFCNKKGFPNRFHSEEVCRLKLAEKKKTIK